MVIIVIPDITSCSAIFFIFAGLSVILPCESESVLLGAAILAACAAGEFTSVQEATRVMSGPGEVIRPDVAEKMFVFCS